MTEALGERGRWKRSGKDKELGRGAMEARGRERARDEGTRPRAVEAKRKGEGDVRLETKRLKRSGGRDILMDRAKAKKLKADGNWERRAGHGHDGEEENQRWARHVW